MTDTLFRALDLIEPGDLVIYHGSITELHGLYIATPCACFFCAIRDRRGDADARYSLTDPFGEAPGTVRCARRQSITRSAACN